MQELLDRSCCTGQTVEVTIEGHQYRINARERWQDRKDTDAPRWQVRLVANDEWPV